MIRNSANFVECFVDFLGKQSSRDFERGEVNDHNISISVERKSAKTLVETRPNVGVSFL